MQLDPTDLALLTVLGTASRAPAALDDIAAGARALAPADWQPTTDTIRAAVDRALARGWVCQRDSVDGDGTLLETTAAGQSHLATLLRRPIPRAAGSFVRACMSAKLCFLDRLALAERAAQASVLAGLYRETLGVVHHLRQLPPPFAGPALDELRGEMVRLEADLAWLDVAASWRVARHAAE